MPKIIPAILTSDVTDLTHKLSQLQGFADWVQIDMMDGTLVANATITLEDLSQVKIAKNFSLEVHLMVLNPASYFPQCQQNNIKRVIFHIEAGDTKKILSEAQKFDFQKGIALNPETSIAKVMPLIQEIDVVVLMSVNPGLQGQAFMPETLDKIKELKKRAPKVKVEIDGGVNLENINMAGDAGADYVVIGSSLFEAENVKKRFEELSRQVRDSR